MTVLAPNRVHTDVVGETNLSPTGWYRAEGDKAGERLETDYERLLKLLSALSPTMTGARTNPISKS